MHGLELSGKNEQKVYFNRLIHTIIDLSNKDNTILKKEDSIINLNYKEIVRTYGGKTYSK